MYHYYGLHGGNVCVRASVSLMHWNKELTRSVGRGRMYVYRQYCTSKGYCTHTVLHAVCSYALVKKGYCMQYAVMYAQRVLHTQNPVHTALHCTQCLMYPVHHAHAVLHAHAHSNAGTYNTPRTYSTVRTHVGLYIMFVYVYYVQSK